MVIDAAIMTAHIECVQKLEIQTLVSSNSRDNLLGADQSDTTVVSLVVFLVVPPPLQPGAYVSGPRRSGSTVKAVEILLKLTARRRISVKRPKDYFFRTTTSK